MAQDVGNHAATTAAAGLSADARPAAGTAAGAAAGAAGNVPFPGVASVAEDADRIAAAVSRVIVGKPEVIRLALICLLSEGHLLIEDVPGTGKTNLAKALARCVAGSVGRVQFTPDLMPSDVTGVSVYERTTASFTFRPGPIFANILVADEINRAAPRTQSALLEAMEERQVTADGTTYPLPRPFLVLATQNPVEMEGTYPLPEAQRDRFFARTSIGYPDQAGEVAMLDARQGGDPLAAVRPIVDTARAAELIAAAESVHLAPALRHYLVALVAATRTSPHVRLGCSPRAVLHLAKAAKASAAIAGRSYVVPDDIISLAVPVLAHRIITTIEASAARLTGQHIIAEIVSRTPVPLERVP